MADNKQDIFEDILNTLPDQLLYALASEKNLILPLNLYDHSGLSMSVSSLLGAPSTLNGIPVRWDGFMPPPTAFAPSMETVLRKVWKRQRRC